MHQIGQTFSTPVHEMGGGIPAGETIFDGVADVYRMISQDTVLRGGEDRVSKAGENGRRT